MSRRLPVYLLLDTSGSMTGEPITAVQNGVQAFLSTLRGDPYALETVHVSVITFDSEAKQVTPLTELPTFQEPQLQAAGCTSLYGALELLCQCVDRDVVKGSKEKKGDWKPLVFLMTDGAPTDDEKEAQALKVLKEHKFGIFVACAAGPYADTSVLKRITESVISLDSTDSETIKKFFKWVSASVSASVAVNETSNSDEPKGLDQLPPPPSGVDISLC